MEDFPANSARSKARTDGPVQEERPAVEQITSAETRRRRGLGRKFKETFIGGSGRMAFEYMVAEVVVPAIRDTIFEAMQGGLDRLIYGDRRPQRGGMPTYSNVGRVDYTRMSQTAAPKPQPTRMLSHQSRARMNFNEIIIPTRMEAEEVLERMYDVLSRYGSVQVGTLYELTGIESTHTDYKWGWTDLRGARTRAIRNRGYALDLPDPEPLG